MNKAEELHNKIMGMIPFYTTQKVDRFFCPSLDIVYDEYLYEVYQKGTHTIDSLYYRYLACVVKFLQPKQVIEIGADKGVSTLMMASELPVDGILYSIDIRNGWEYVPEDMKNIVKIVGKSTDAVFEPGIDLTKTKLWLIDGNHEEDNVREEYNLYKKYWLPGTVILFDDVDYFPPFWKEIEGDKTTDIKVHGNDFGVLVL